MQDCVGKYPGKCLKEIARIDTSKVSECVDTLMDFHLPLSVVEYLSNTRAVPGGEHGWSFYIPTR